MWPFKSVKKLKDSGMFANFTDWHSHILPGVDDGIPTIEDSIEVLKAYEELGFKRVWLTPHVMEDFPNTPADLKVKFNELQTAWTGNVELKLAAENMLDSLFEQRLEDNDLLPIGDDKSYLLVETSYYTPPMDFENILDKIKAKGYHPILAHPERYRYMEEKDYMRLKNKDVFFQMNFTSLVGGYGDTAKKKAEWLLDKGMINLLGSDVHRLKSTMSMIDFAPSKQKHLNNILRVVNTGEIK
ncbi:MAG: capsular biosynthesis protein [Bacteroides sp.]|nr:capsular biosynthesis protein [Bacteroides sp.]